MTTLTRPSAPVDDILDEAAPGASSATGAPATPPAPGWVSLIVTAACRGLLVMIASMALWAVLPAALSWHVTVVMSGSMEPALRPGDVVASRPIAGSAVRPGQVVLVDDPDHQGRLRLHRLAKVTNDGELILRGDANRADDSTPVRRNAVHGVGSLRVPFIGAPAYWLRTHQLAPLLPTTIAVALIALGAIGRRGTDGPPDDESGSSASGSGPTPRRRRRRPRRRTIVMLTTAALTATTVATNAPAQAATAFMAKSANATSSWTAGYFSCSAAVLSDKPYLYYPFSEKSGSTVADTSGNGRTGTYYTGLGAGVSYGTTGPCAGDNATGVTLNGIGGAASAPGPITGPQAYTQEIWFKTTSVLGGSLIGFASTATGVAGSYDRHLYMTSAGRLVAGVHPGSTNQTITSTAAYNDGAWHLADVTLSASGGLTLYVDGVQVAANPDLKGAQDFSGYWRFGDTPLTTWPDAPLGSHFSGSLQGAAIFTSALAVGQIKNHYAGR